MKTWLIYFGPFSSGCGALGSTWASQTCVPHQRPPMPAHATLSICRRQETIAQLQLQDEDKTPSEGSWAAKMAGEKGWRGSTGLPLNKGRWPHLPHKPRQIKAL